MSERCHCIDSERHGHLDDCPFAEIESLRARLAQAEQIVRAVDKVGALAVENGGSIVLTQGAVLFAAAANYLVVNRGQP